MTTIGAAGSTLPPFRFDISPAKLGFSQKGKSKNRKRKEKEKPVLPYEDKEENREKE